MKSAPKNLYNPFALSQGGDPYLGYLEVFIDGRTLCTKLEMDGLMARDIPYKYVQERLQRELVEGIRKELFQ